MKLLSYAFATLILGMLATVITTSYADEETIATGNTSEYRIANFMAANIFKNSLLVFQNF